MKKLFVVLLFLTAYVTAHTQTYVNITADACLSTQSGTSLIAKGYATVQATSAFRIGGGGLALGNPSLPTQIVNGSLVPSIVVPNPATTNPTNIGYTINITDEDSHYTQTFKNVATSGGT